MDNVIIKLVEKLSKIDEIECILLAGSQTNNTVDENSDYDIYVYSSKLITVKKRKEALDEFFSYCEYDNRYWETEDDGILLESGKIVELIYRDFDFIEAEYNRIFINNISFVGYSTCIWSNVAGSEILFDRNGRGTELVLKYKNQNYPLKLKKEIISKNMNLLIGKIPSYYEQIEKALLRKDILSINHRVAGYLASYFDILFAINETPHPGEKKLLKIVENNCKLVPLNWKSDITHILKYSGDPDERLLESLRQSHKNIAKLVAENGL